VNASMFSLTWQRVKSKQHRRTRDSDISSVSFGSDLGWRQ
jgi:hypothetical protein